MGEDGPSRKIIRYMELARIEALKSNYRFRLGCIALKNGKIIAKGFNSITRNGKLFRDYALFSIHAEADCLLRGGFNGDTLIVARVMKNGESGCSKPCYKCCEYIKNSSIKKIIYTDWNGKIVIERVNELTTNEHYASGWKANTNVT